MKKVMLSAAALMVGAITFAQSNVSDVLQTGSGNTSDVTQTGSMNDSDVMQDGTLNR